MSWYRLSYLRWGHCKAQGAEKCCYLPTPTAMLLSYFFSSTWSLTPGNLYCSIYIFFFYLQRKLFNEALFYYFSLNLSALVFLIAQQHTFLKTECLKLQTYPRTEIWLLVGGGGWGEEASVIQNGQECRELRNILEQDSWLFSPQISSRPAKSGCPPDLDLRVAWALPPVIRRRSYIWVWGWKHFCS